jgi:uracil-DNA glycosylase
MDKQTQLNKIAGQIKRCKECKTETSGKAVVGEGSFDAKIVFIGEAPGRKEAETGRPFIGRSGQLLRKEIKNIGLDEKDVFITSAVKYLPDRGTPTKTQIKHGQTHLWKQLGIINPKMIVLLGNSAIRGVLDQSLPIKKWHGKILEQDSKKYYFSFHPAAALRATSTKKYFIEDFLALKKYL